MAAAPSSEMPNEPPYALPEGDGGFSVVHLALAAVLAPLVAATWLALASAQIGRFSPAFAWAGAAMALLGTLTVAWRLRRRLTWSVWDVATLSIVVVALVSMLRIWPAATPWPAFTDASWYVNAGARIAADGTLRFETPALPDDPDVRRALVATLGDHRTAGVVAMPRDDTQGMFNVAFAVSDVAAGPVTPYHPPFFTSSVALAAWALDPWRAGRAVLPWAIAWLLAVAALSRGVFGAPAAPLATAVAALGPAFAYYGRAPFAEMCAGALAVAALVALVALPEDRDGPVRAGLAGLLLGLSALAKAELLLLIPVIVLWWLVSRRRAGGAREVVAFVMGAAVPLGHFVSLSLDVSRVYVTLNGGGVLALAIGMGPWWVAGALLVVVLMVAMLARRSRGQTTTGLDLRRLAAILVVLALAAATVLGLLGPEGQPPSMVAILSWLTTPLGLWAAVIGLVLALETGHRRSGPVVAVALLALPVVLVQPAVTESLSSVYTARRLVAFGVPVVATLAAGAAVVPLSGLRGRRPLSWAALAGVALIVANLGLASVPLVRLHEFGGGVTASRKLAAMGEPSSVFLFGTVLDGSYAGRLAAAMWNLEDRATAVIASPDTDLGAIATAVDGWQSEGRRVLLVVDDLDRAPEVPGYEHLYVDETVVIPQVLSPNPGLPPRIKSPPLELHFSVVELVPVGSLGTG